MAEAPSFFRRADDFMRGAASTVTFGMADRIAGVGDSLIYGGSIGDNIAKEQRLTEEATYRDVGYNNGEAAGFLLGAAGLLKGGIAIGRHFFASRAAAGVARGAEATGGSVSAAGPVSAGTGTAGTGTAGADAGVSAGLGTTISAGGSMDPRSQLLNLALQGWQKGGLVGKAAIVGFGAWAFHTAEGIARDALQTVVSYTPWGSIGGTSGAQRDQEQAKARALTDTPEGLRARGLPRSRLRTEPEFAGSADVDGTAPASLPPVPRSRLRAESAQIDISNEDLAKYNRQIAEDCRTGTLRDPLICP